MKCEITKRFDFHAAHQIPNHKGQCSRLHGHTYFLEVTVRGEVKLKTVHSTESDYGMVLDFDVLKKIYKERIEPKVEHQYLNETLGLPVTTAECIAAWCWDEYRAGGITPHRIRLYETPTSFAEVKAGDLL
jgi:6-pyruvoyltetrahydropterin/6-carboxytetrahydropterin synthase